MSAAIGVEQSMNRLPGGAKRVPSGARGGRCVRIGVKDMPAEAGGNTASGGRWALPLPAGALLPIGLLVGMLLGAGILSLFGAQMLWNPFAIGSGLGGRASAVSIGAKRAKGSRSPRAEHS